jgi:hypothetical protein
MWSSIHKANENGREELKKEKGKMKNGKRDAKRPIYKDAQIEKGGEGRT